MADEVTKKDLQSLQGYCNKQIAEAEKRVMAKIAEVEKNIDTGINKAIETLNKNDAELLRGHNDQSKRLGELTALVNQHAQVINQLREKK